MLVVVRDGHQLFRAIPSMAFPRLKKVSRCLRVGEKILASATRALKMSMEFARIGALQLVTDLSQQVFAPGDAAFVLHTCALAAVDDAHNAAPLLGFGDHHLDRI